MTTEAATQYPPHILRIAARRRRERYVREHLDAALSATGYTARDLLPRCNIAKRHAVYTHMQANATGEPITAAMIAQAVGCETRCVRRAIEYVPTTTAGNPRVRRPVIERPPSERAMFECAVAMIRSVAPFRLFETCQRGKWDDGDETLAEKRAEVWWRMHQPDPLNGRVLSTTEIAAATLGRRSAHSTVAEGIRRYERMLEANPGRLETARQEASIAA